MVILALVNFPARNAVAKSENKLIRWSCWMVQWFKAIELISFDFHTSTWATLGNRALSNKVCFGADNEKLLQTKASPEGGGSFLPPWSGHRNKENKKPRTSGVEPAKMIKHVTAHLMFSDQENMSSHTHTHTRQEMDHWSDPLGTESPHMQLD